MIYGKLVDIESVNVLSRPPMREPSPAVGPKRPVRRAFAAAPGNSTYPSDTPGCRVELAVATEALERRNGANKVLAVVYDRIYRAAQGVNYG